MIELGDTTIFQIESGGTPKSTEGSCWGGGIHWATLVDLPQSNYITQISRTERAISQAGLKDSAAKVLPPGTVIVSSRATIEAVHNQAMTALLPTPKVEPYYLNAVLVSSREYWKSVAKIEAEQALVNANKQLIARFEAKIKTTINRVCCK